MPTLKIELDYEEYTENPWTLVATQAFSYYESVIIAAVIGKNLEQVQDRLDLLLIEFGYDIYVTETY